jgi:hypothetical protein
MFIKWLGFNEAVIDLPAEERFSGKSSYSFRKKLKMASEIITFMKENHRLGPVLQKSSLGTSLRQKLFGDPEEKTNYRYLDLGAIDKNFMYDTTKASRLCPFRWNIKNTK